MSISTQILLEDLQVSNYNENRGRKRKWLKKQLNKFFSKQNARKLTGLATTAIIFIIFNTKFSYAIPPTMFGQLFAEPTRLDQLQSKMGSCVSLLCKMKYTSLIAWHKFYLSQGAKELTVWGTVYMGTQVVQYIAPIIGVTASPVALAMFIKISVICGAVRGAGYFVPGLENWDMLKEIHSVSKGVCAWSLFAALGSSFGITFQQPPT